MTKKQSKKELALELFESNIKKYCCPMCATQLAVHRPFSLCCRSHHNFDLARNGYLNLLNTQIQTKYSKELFLARRKVFSSSIYSGLLTELNEMIQRLRVEKTTILDAGCGEGTILFRLHNLNCDIQFMGIDIAREGIRLAASYEAPIMWCVADLAQLPLNNGVVNVVLNILSPANYKEFERVLRSGGSVIKVIPGKSYLQEIRNLLGDTTPYCNEEVFDNLQAKLKVEEVKSVYYKVRMIPELWPAIVKMTPLGFHHKLVGNPPASLTIDLQVVRGYFP